MKKILPLLFSVLVTTMAYSQGVITPLQDWKNSSGEQNGIYKSKIVTDNSNNVYVAGATKNGLTSDILLVKYNAFGIQQWVQQYDGGGNGEDVATGLCLDTIGNVYITGYTTGTVLNPTNVDLVTIKYNSNGTQEWLTIYDGGFNAYDAGADITLDNTGMVYVTGKSYNASANSDIITIKYDPIGTQQWVTRYNHTSNLNDEGLKISVRNNSIVVSGIVQTSGTAYKYGLIQYEDITGFQTALTINNTSSSGADQINDMVQDALGNTYIAGATLIAGQGYDYSILKLNPSLGIVWQSTYNGIDNLDDIAKGIKVDSFGNVFVTGYTTASAGGKDFCTLKYNSSGTQQWIQTYNDTLNGDDEANALVLDDSANCFVTGYATADTTNNQADLDYYTIKYSNSGVQQWARSTDSDVHLADKSTGIAIDNANSIIITGQSALTDTTYQYLTTKYLEKNIVTPTDYNNETAASTFLFYKNNGQLVNTSNQAIPDVKYYTNNTYPQYYINNNSYSFVFAHVDTVASTQDTLQRIDLTFDGTNAMAVFKTYPLEEKAEYLNYFLPQCPNGITGVHGNQRLITPDLYADIDLQYSSNQNGTKYYFIIKPGGDPANIQLNYTGASSFNLDGNTNSLTINSGIGSITYDRPTVYQLSDTNAVIPISGWTADWQTNAANNKYKFNIGSYDSTKILIIEVDQGNASSSPQHANTNHEWETYFGGTGNDEGMAVSTDTDGNAYFTGKTNSSPFPVTTGLVFQDSLAGLYDAYIARFNKPNYSTDNGDNNVWTTYFGAGQNDCGLGIVNIGGSTGKVIVTGLSENAAYSMPSGNNGNYIQDNSRTGKNAFILRLNNFDGSLDWLTFFGGDGDDVANCIARDNSGNIYIAGKTSTASYSSVSCGIPTDSLFPNCNPNSNFNNNNTNGGGTDGFIAKFNNIGTLQYSSFWGGSGDDEIKAIALDPNNNIFIGGKTTGGTGFPFPSVLPTGKYNQTTYGGGTADGFIAKFDNTQLLKWSTFYGGNVDDEVKGIDVDVSGSANVFITGRTSSLTPACSTCTCAVPPTGQFPLCNPGSGALYQSVHGNLTTGIGYDAVIAGFSNTGQIQWSTYYGGENDDEGTGIVCDISTKDNGIEVPNVIITGQLYSGNLSAQNPAYSLLNGSGFLYLGDPLNNNYMPISSSILEGDQFIAMFDNLGRPLWSTNYGDLDQTGNDKNNAITSTKSLTNNSDKYIYLTGYTEHAEHEVTTSLSNAYFQNPTSSPINREVVMSRFGYNLHEVTGIKESFLDNGELLIYPNPSSENIYIVGTLHSAAILLKIYDIIGREVYSEKIETNILVKKAIDVKSWKQGIYILQLVSDKLIISKKFIKQ